MRHEVALLSAKPLQEKLRQFARISDKLLDLHRVVWNRRGVGFASAPLIPVHDNEMLFELRVQMRERHLWKTRTTVEKQQQRPGAIVPADLYPLLDSAESNFFERGDSGRGGDLDLRRRALLPGKTQDNERSHGQESERCSWGNDVFEELLQEMRLVPTCERFVLFL